VKLWDRWWTWFDSSEQMLARWLRAARAALLGEMPPIAGGVALFSILALVPTLAGVVALYSLVSDPSEIERHLQGLEAVLPPNALGFLTDQLSRQTARSSSDLGFALTVSLGGALYSARGAARAMVDALNRAYRVRERREWVRLTLVTLMMAAGTLIGLILMLVVVVALPATFTVLGFEDYGIVTWLPWLALMIVLFIMLMLLYRFGPSPRPLGTVRHLWPGALIATVLVIVMSLLLSVWVDRVANYDVYYGAFGSVIVVMLWFYLQTIAVVAGGFVNAELERASGAPEPDRSMY
jgi:membrane protein